MTIQKKEQHDLCRSFSSEWSADRGDSGQSSIEPPPPKCIRIMEGDSWDCDPKQPMGSFDPRRTLGDGICESLRNQGIAKAEREEKACFLLEQCGLSEDFLKRYPHQVSGGQCQRAAIARALMCDPEILIFDEATSALDVTVQKQIVELLMKLQKERKLSYLFICHNLALVQMFCDRVMVLYDGRIVEQGTPEDVILHPKSEYAGRLVNAIF